MVVPARPAHLAIVEQAVRATGAASGWLLTVHHGTLRVVAVAGDTDGRDLVGYQPAVMGARAYVLASGQPAALMPQPTDLTSDGAGGFPGVPPSLLAVRCGDEPVMGVLEVAAKHGAEPFTFADIDLLSSLAQVAAAVLAEGDRPQPVVATPTELAAELEALSATDPQRYGDLARLIGSLLGLPS